MNSNNKAMFGERSGAEIGVGNDTVSINQKRGLIEKMFEKAIESVIAADLMVLLVKTQDCLAGCFYGRI